MSIVEKISSPEARQEITLSFIDIVDSTKMKEREPESSWATNVAWMYQEAEAVVGRSGAGEVVKYLGDGVMLAHRDATQAINDAIAFSEAIKDAVTSRYVRFQCSCAIATGKVLVFDDLRGNPDYLGLVADRAFRLCGAAASGAIFVDLDTVACAQLNKVTSLMGTMLARNLDDYLGECQRIDLKGFSDPIRYREVLWERRLLGLRANTPRPKRGGRTSFSSTTNWTAG
jgi:class 3 adenylate cyclase